MPAILRRLWPTTLLARVTLLVPQQPETVRMQVRLSDGCSLYVLARRVPMPVADWVTWLLLAQLLVLAAWPRSRTTCRRRSPACACAWT